MFKKLIHKFFVWFYDQLEAEKNRRKYLELLQLMMEKERKQSKYDEAAKKIAQQRLADLEKRKAMCSHLKGGKRPISTYYYQAVDYNVMTHTFPDNRLVVKCLSCSKEWSLANGNLEEGLRMRVESSNTPSTSEIFFGKPQDREKPERTDFQPQETEHHSLAPYVSNGYIKLWERLTKKFDKTKKARVARLKKIGEAKSGPNHNA